MKNYQEETKKDKTKEFSIDIESINNRDKNNNDENQDKDNKDDKEYKKDKDDKEDKVDNQDNLDQDGFLIKQRSNTEIYFQVGTPSLIKRKSHVGIIYGKLYYYLLHKPI